MTTITLRRATREDLPAIAVLAARLVRQHHAFDPRRFMLFPEPIEAGYGRFFASQLDAPGTVILVACRGDAVVGYAFGALEERDWNALRDACGALHDVYVDEGARGLGAGRALVEAMLRALKDLGAPRVVLMTATQNEAAQQLFERLGFRRTMVELTRESDGG